MSEVLSEERNEIEDSSQVNIPRVVQVIEPGRAFQNPSPLREHLVEMGFTAEEIDRVLVRPLDLEEAVGSLLNNSAREQSISTQCLICGEDLADSKVLVQDCFHVFCQSCISAYVELKILEGQVLRFSCPHHGCTNELSNEQVEAELSEDLLQKLALFKRNEELSRNQNLRWCPRPDCQGYDIGSLRKTSLKCNTCEYDFCYYCGEPPHAKKKCKAEADKQLDRWSRKNGVKYCPNCKRRVMKSAGCNHMTCPRCQYQWCWLCGERFHSFHFEQCTVLLAKMNDPAWYIILGLMLAPLLFPFTFTLTVFYSIYQRFPEESDNCIHSFIRKKWVSFPLIFISTSVLSPLIVALMLVGSGPLLLFEIRDDILVRNPNAKYCSSLCLWAILFSVFGLVLSPVIACVILVGLVVAQFFGVGLIAFKGMMLVRRCFNKSKASPYANY
jgi:hypothetical protein